jgi:hypothetical protein
VTPALPPNAAFDFSAPSPAAGTPALGTPAPTPAPQPSPGLSATETAKLNQEWAATGALSPESYAFLGAKGYDQQTVNNYIEGQRAIANQRIAEVYQAVGGQPAYDAAKNWASQNLQPAEKTILQNELRSGDPARMQAAARMLTARFQQSQGPAAPGLVHGNAPQFSTVAPFRSAAEVTAAMKDPRYGADQAYRDSVQARMQASGGIFSVTEVSKAQQF